MTTNIQNNHNKNQNHNDYISNIPEAPKGASQADWLAIKSYTDGLSDYIAHAKSPLSISLNGEWGSGKTSIMNTIKGNLCDGDNAKFYGIWINTWQFSLLDSTQAPQAIVRILQSIVNQIMVLKPDYKRRDKIDKLIGAMAIISTNLKSISNVAGNPLFGIGQSTVGVVASVSTTLKNFFRNKPSIASDDNASLVNQLSTEIKELIEEIINNPTKNCDLHIHQYVPYTPFNLVVNNSCPCVKIAITAILGFCNMFAMLGFGIYNLCVVIFNILSIILNYSWLLLNNIFEVVLYILKTILCNNNLQLTKNKRNGFIFFIDDLDRINPKMALEIIEVLSSVFSFQKCIFILAIDEHVLFDVIKSKINWSKFDNDKQEWQYQQYLNRLINLSIDVPVEFYDVKSLLKSALQNISFFNAKELSNDELFDSLEYVVCVCIGKNPRAIKQMINQLSLLGSLTRQTFTNNERNMHMPWHVETIIKEMVLILQCIKIAYPNVFAELLNFPYFKGWSASNFDEHYDSNELEENMEYIRKMTDYEDVAPWEAVLYEICKHDNLSFSYFYKIRRVFKIIDKTFSNYIKERRMRKTEKVVYNKILTNAFAYFYRKNKWY